MATKVLKKVDITTAGGYTATADDATREGVGTGAVGQLLGGHDIRFRTSATEETFIPYHAIDHAVITTSTTTVTVDDDMCQPV